MSTTIADALAAGEKLLAATSSSASIDVRLLATHLFSLDRVGLIREGRRELTTAEEAAWHRLLTERAAGRPIAQLLGEWEFYSLPLFVDESVLIPRPETELLIDWAKEMDRDTPVRSVVDVGTGSGCIAIALAHELPECCVIAIDRSRPALAIAQRNIARHGLEARIQLIEGNLLQPVALPVDLIVSNPPYVEPGDPTLEPNVRRFEPDEALHDHLDGDGLGYYRRLADTAGSLVHPDGSLLLEVGDTQAAEVAQLFPATEWQCEIRCDLAGIERAVRCRRKAAK